MYFPFQDLAQGLFGSGAITMYPSYNNGNTNNTLDQTIPYHKPSLSDHNHPLIPSSFFSSPSPYNHYEDDLIFLQCLFQHHHHQQQQQQQQQPPLIPEASAPDSNNSEIHNRHKFLGLVEQIPKKRISKKDRHSKIETAQGPRDRRMRLSLEIARKFFNLQDMLGVDKASKTVGWLLTKSKTAIEELKRDSARVKNSSSIVGGNNYSASSTSECEVVSGIAESAVDGNRHARNGKGSKTLGKEKKNVRAISRKLAFDPIARESRDKARARARERTEKKKFDESKQTLEAVNCDTNQLGSRSHFENCKESGNQRLDLLADVDQELSSSIIFNHNNGISQENHFTGFQVYGKPYWEAYNNINLC